MKDTQMFVWGVKQQHAASISLIDEALAVGSLIPSATHTESASLPKRNKGKRSTRSVQKGSGLCPTNELPEPLTHTLAKNNPLRASKDVTEDGRRLGATPLGSETAELIELGERNETSDIIQVPQI
jgi:hypothetical protein